MSSTSLLAVWATRAVREQVARPVRSSEVMRDVFEKSPPPETRPLPSDAEVVAGLSRGEEWAALMLYERVQDHVTRTLQRLLRRRDDVLDDLVQTTFERMIRFLSQRSLTGSVNLRGWSRAVATNVAIDFLRRELSERRLFVSSDAELDEAGAHHTFSEASLDARASLERVQTIIAGMQPKYAETVILHDVLGHELSEIAVLMGASVAATQSRLVRGRKDLLARAARLRKP